MIRIEYLDDLEDIRNDVYLVLIETEFGSFTDYYIDSENYAIDESVKDELISDKTQPRYKWYSHAGFWIKRADMDACSLLSLNRFQKMFVKDMEWTTDDDSLNTKIGRLREEKNEKLDFAFVYFNVLLEKEKDHRNDEDYKWFDEIYCSNSDDGIYEVEFKKDSEVVLTLLKKEENKNE